MSRQLPSRPNIEFLKKQAASSYPDASHADALHALAREYGFATWPLLKAHVESLPTTVNPFVGTWTVDPARSQPDRLNAYQSATLEFALTGTSLMITTRVAELTGKEVRGRLALEVDGKPHPLADTDYVSMARWVGTHMLDAVTLKAGQEVGRVSYKVSGDGATLTLDGSGKEHNGFPAVKQSVVFTRG